MDRGGERLGTGAVPPRGRASRWASRWRGLGRATRWSLVAILLLSLTANLVGIGWGLPSPARNAISSGDLGHYGTAVPWSKLRPTRPFDSLHPDEEEPILDLSNMQPKRLDLNPHRFLYPTLWTYATGGAIVATATATGTPLRADQQSYVHTPGDADELFLAGRVLTALFSTVGVGLLFAVALALGWERRSALLAAALLGVSPLWVRNSHYLTVDVPAAVWMILAALLCLRCTTTGSRRTLVLTGAAIGLAASTKYPAGLMVLVLPWAAVHLRARGHTVRRVLQATGLSLVAAGISFAVTSPYVLLDWHQFTSDLGHETQAVAGHASVPAGLSALVWGQGTILAVVAVAAMLWLVVRIRTPASQLLLLWTAAGSLTMATAGGDFMRYLIPMLPPLALAVAGLVRELGRPRVGRAGIGRAVGAALAALCLVSGAGYTVNELVLLDRPTDVRVVAGQRLAAALPAGASIGVFGSDSLYNPIIDFDRYHVVGIDPTQRRGPDPDAVVVTSYPGRSEPSWPRTSGWTSRHRYRVVRLTQMTARLFIAGAGRQPDDAGYLDLDLTLYIASGPR